MFFPSEKPSWFFLPNRTKHRQSCIRPSTIQIMNCTAPTVIPYLREAQNIAPVFLNFDDWDATPNICPCHFDPVLIPAWLWNWIIMSRLTHMTFEWTLPPSTQRGSREKIYGTLPLSNTLKSYLIGNCCLRSLSKCHPGWNFTIITCHVFLEALTWNIWISIRETMSEAPRE